MEVVYCDNCSSKIGQTSAVRTDNGKVYCSKCAPLYEHTSSALLNVALPAGTSLEEQTTVVGLPNLIEREATKFYFCETCGKRLTESQIEQGLGRDKKVKGVYCKDCAIGISTVEFPSINAPEKQSGPTRSQQIKGKNAASAVGAKSSPNVKFSQIPDARSDFAMSVTPKRSFSTAMVMVGIGVIALAVFLMIILTSSKRDNATTPGGTGKEVRSDPVPNRLIPLADEHAGAQEYPPGISETPPQTDTADDLETVRAELKKLNPGFDGTLATESKDGHVWSLRCSNNLVPLARLTDLKSLQLSPSKASKLTDLSPLRYMKNLLNLSLMKNDVRDLSPLQDLSRLDTLVLHNLPLSNLDPIHTLKIHALYVFEMPVENISCLKGMRLTDSRLL